MKYIIKEYSNYVEAEILTLYESVGWKNYTQNPGMLRQAFQNSLAIYGAYDNEKLIGVIRVVGDGASIVFIQDILIFPEYQRKGIGTMLLKHIMDRYSFVYQMELMTDNTPKTVSFYQSMGFKRVDDMDCCAFIKYR